MQESDRNNPHHCGSQRYAQHQKTKIKQDLAQIYWMANEAEYALPDHARFLSLFAEHDRQTRFRQVARKNQQNDYKKYSGTKWDVLIEKSRVLEKECVGYPCRHK